jgi:endonuclease/exonuclease/phosphatase (EEP) superfamily protein YafD
MTRSADRAMGTLAAPLALAGPEATGRRDAATSRGLRGRVDAPTAISLLYTVLLFLWHALRFTPVGQWAPFEIVDVFGLVLFAPIPLLLLLSMLCASRRAGLILMAPVLLLALTYGPTFVPRSIPALPWWSSPPAGPTLRVMTANLLVSNDNLSEVTGLIRAERPDVIALQELSPKMAEHLSRELRAQYPHQLLEPSTVPDGLGILSRYPLRPERLGEANPRACMCQRVTFGLGNTSATLVNVHPWPPRVGYFRVGRVPVPTSFETDQTMRALDTALEGLAERAGSLIVLGDFNVGDRQPAYRRLRGALLDAHVEAGWGPGFSFPALPLDGLPDTALVRIDYILHDRSLAASSTRTGTMPGSDHHYVVTDLAVR